MRALCSRSSQHIFLSVCRSVKVLFLVFAGLPKEEEPVQNPCRSVKEEGTGQGPRGVGSVEGQARAEVGASLPASQHIYTHCSAEQA